MLSAPRAGRSAGPGRGRGHLRGSGRANSPQANTQAKQRSTSPNPRGGQHGTAARSRGNVGRGRAATTRGRGNSVWIRGGARGSLGGANAAVRDTRTADQKLQAAFTFTGDRAWRAPENAANKDYKANIKNLWETLKRNRVGERQNAIREGKISDPDKKLRLSEAIKSVGTCEEMCPQWERITRIYDGNVLAPEKVQLESGTSVPCEEKMVKRFQRSAAGDDEQLPSDLRPPRVLRRSLEYMLDRVLNESAAIENVQDFLWDRSRAIRNDFSIQQVTSIEDVKIAIECFERIARYHIAALHLTSHPDHSPRVEHKQENEQLTNTLTSLFQYYEDNRGRLDCPNEPEFRAYYILREIDQERRPDLESRVQQWPSKIARHPRVKVALKLYAAAGDVSAALGPLDPKKAVAVAQANAMRFWSIVSSPAVPYLMACCAETYFRVIRDTALTIVWRASRRLSKIKLDDMLLSDLTDMMGLDNEDQTQQFCERQGFSIGEREDGNAFLDLTSISASQHELPGSDAGANQIFSERLVEDKRHGRSPAAIIKGLSFAEARSRGLLEDSADVDMETDASAQLPTNTASTSQLPATTSNTFPPANPSGIFGQPTTTPFGFQSPAPSSNPFASNPFAKPAPSDPALQPSGLASTQTSSGGSPSVFAQPAPRTVSSNNPFSIFGSQPPSNQQIAANVFNTPSFTLTPTKVGDSAATQSRNDSNAQSASLFFTPGSPGSSFTKKAVETAPTSVIPTPGQTFAKSSEGTTGSDLGTSIFSKKVEVAPTSIFASKPESSTEASETGRPGSPSLFVPLETPQDSTKGNQLQPSNVLSDPQTVSTAPVTKAPMQFQSVFGLPAGQTQKVDSLQQNKTENPFSKPSSPAPDLVANSTQASPKVIPVSELFSPKPPSAPSLLFSNTPTHTESMSGAANTDTQKASSASNSKVKFPNPVKAPSGKDTSTAPTASLSTQATPPSSSSTATSSGIGETATSKPSLFSPQAATSAAATIQQTNHAPANLTKHQAAAPTAPKPAPKPSRPSDEEYIDKLIRAFALGPNGMIKQFIENEVAETVRGCIRKLNRDREKAEVKLARRFLLSCKYMRRWKNIAWTRKLQREAKHRRREFRKSLHDLALSSKNSSRAPSEDIAEELHRPVMLPKQITSNPMPPPKSILKNSTSANATGGPQFRESGIFGGTIDKYKDKAILRPPPRVSKIDASSAAANVSRGPKSTRYRGLSTSMIGQNGLLHDQLMKRASRLVNGRTDTTRTDYFKLKSLGIDPNTPLVPASRKRRSDEEVEADARKSRMSPGKLGSSSSSGPPFLTNGTHAPSNRSSLQLTSVQSQQTIADNDDDELFAQIRAVKDAMSETESWYREYREQSERTSADIANETEKQRKLREWKPSVSRTEARWKRDGLPSFLRPSWTPRETVSVERAESQQKESEAKRLKTGQEEDVATEEDDEMYDEDREGEDEGEYDEEEDEEDEEAGEDQEEYDRERYEEEEGDYDEEDYDEDHDTQAFGGFGHGAVTNTTSAFATKGASADDAIEL